MTQIGATGIIFIAGAVGCIWALIQFLTISRIKIQSAASSSESTGLVSGANDEATTSRLLEIYEAIYEGAESFLRAEYTVCIWFVVCFSIVVLVLVMWGTGWNVARGVFTAISFVLGAVTSMASGYLGMKVAVYSNVRTTISAQKSGWTDCFNTAFRAGAVMGFALCGLGIIMLYGTLLVFRLYYPDPEDWIYITESITGYGLGGSVIAMFGRVGGVSTCILLLRQRRFLLCLSSLIIHLFRMLQGIYTKAADVGADLVGTFTICRRCLFYFAMPSYLTFVSFLLYRQSCARNS